MQRSALTPVAISLSFFLASGWVAVVGCARPVARTVPVFPVDGELFVGGKPAIGAEVTFVPEGEGPGAKGATVKVRVDGHFVPTQPDGAIGLPEGDYALTVRWPDGQGPLGSTASGSSMSIGRCSVKPGVNLIPPISMGRQRPR